MTNKKTPIKKNQVSIKAKTKKKSCPMTFHDNPKKNIVWYTVSIILVSVVVLANIYPSDTLMIADKFIETRPIVHSNIPISTKVDVKNIQVNEAKLTSTINSIGQLEGVLKKNVKSVENALSIISKRETRSVEQLDAIAKTMLGLDVRLAQLQQEIINLQQKKAENSKIQNPSRIFLGQMMIFLTDSYHRGNITHKQLNNLRDFSKTVALNEKMVEAVEALIIVTPDEGPITLTELSLLAGKLMKQGTPEIDDLLQETSATEGYLADAKRYLSDWVDIKKLNSEGENHPWIKSLEKVQQALAKGNVEKVQAMLDNEKSFERDTRIDPFKVKISTYIKQQLALNTVLSTYSHDYVMTAQ